VVAHLIEKKITASTRRSCIKAVKPSDQAYFCAALTALAVISTPMKTDHH